MAIKDSYLGQAWLVLALALCFGAALAGVELGLREKIEQNKRDEITNAVPKLVPHAETGTREDIDGYPVYEARDAAGKHVGWVIKAHGMGFSDRIELLIGLDRPAERITGLWVLDQKETPNLGSRIADEEEDFRRTFAGGELSASQAVRVVKAAPSGANQIQAITGATVSSESVCKIVNKALRELRAKLMRKARRIQEQSRTRPTATGPATQPATRPTTRPAGG